MIYLAENVPAWQEDFNSHRPPGSLGYLAPPEFVRYCADSQTRLSYRLVQKIGTGQTCKGVARVSSHDFRELRLWAVTAAIVFRVPVDRGDELSLGTIGAGQVDIDLTYKSKSLILLMRRIEKCNQLLRYDMLRYQHGFLVR